MDTNVMSVAKEIEGLIDFDAEQSGFYVRARYKNVFGEHEDVMSGRVKAARAWMRDLDENEIGVYMCATNMQPDIKRLARELANCDKARKLIGFTPKIAERVKPLITFKQGHFEGEKFWHVAHAVTGEQVCTGFERWGYEQCVHQRLSVMLRIDRHIDEDPAVLEAGFPDCSDEQMLDSLAAEISKNDAVLEEIGLSCSESRQNKSLKDFALEAILGSIK